MECNPTDFGEDIDQMKRWCEGQLDCVGFAYHPPGPNYWGFYPKRSGAFSQDAPGWYQKGKERWQWHFMEERAAGLPSAQAQAMYGFNLTVCVRGATTGETLLLPVELLGTVIIADVMQRMEDAAGLDAFTNRCRAAELIHGTTTLLPSQRLGEITDVAGGVLELTAVFTVKQAEASLKELVALDRAHPEATDVLLTADEDQVDLLCLVEKLPKLEGLTINFNGSFLYNVGADYWTPLKQLAPTLQRLHFSNHHGGRSGGQIRQENIYEAIMGWGDEGPKLLSFKVTGAMSSGALATYLDFVRSNQTLRPDLEEFIVQYWFANPPLVNTEILQAITKRYQKLRLLEVGSCVSLSDAAFKYFQDNEEGIQAGLELEDMGLTCIVNVEGVGWLDVENVKRNLPKFKKFRIGGGRCFCTCGDAQCGSAASRIECLRAERGLEFEHGARHW